MKCILFLIPFLLLSPGLFPGTSSKIIAKTGHWLTIGIGAREGVKIDMKGKVQQIIIDNGVQIPFNLGIFIVKKVTDDSAELYIEKVGAHAQVDKADQVEFYDNAVVAAGTIAMKTNHTLSASATAIPQYTLNVTRGTGVTGNPAAGTPTYSEEARVPYNYSLLTDYKILTVTLDGNTVAASGTIIMNGNHTLIASATAILQYKLTVHKGTGVDGTPNITTTYSGRRSVSYAYTIQSGYRDLVVMLDGDLVAASGTITMNGNHTLIASATSE